MSGRRLLDSLDFNTIVAAVVLAAVGVFSIASATMEQAGLSSLWRVQLIWCLLALLAAAVVVVGAEWEQGEATVRRMDTGEESRVPIEEVVAWARR